MEAKEKINTTNHDFPAQENPIKKVKTSESPPKFDDQPAEIKPNLDASSSSSSGSDSEECFLDICFWVEEQKQRGLSGKNVLEMLGIELQPETSGSEEEIWSLAKEILMDISQSHQKPRKRIPNFSRFEDAVELIKTSKNIVILTGAGVSVSCGIPDFRSRNGIYSRLAVDFPELPNPQSMFDIRYFRRDPRPFFSFAKEIYPGNFQPSASHFFIKLLENHNKLLRNYCQNIDTLEQVSGIRNIINCHGSFSTASCMVCKHQTAGEHIKVDIMEGRIPYCEKCRESGVTATVDGTAPVMKPDIVFFHEQLPSHFHDSFQKDCKVVDLLIVIGSSLKVQPVASVPKLIPAKIPQILINREPLPHMVFDIELLGNCDEILSHLCWKMSQDSHSTPTPSSTTSAHYWQDFTKLCTPPSNVQHLQCEFVHPNRYLFPGAEPSRTDFYTDSSSSDQDQSDDDHEDEFFGNRHDDQ